MSCRVLLISANRYQFPDPVFPLGLSCINAALVGAGHQTECMDVNIDSLDSVGHLINEFCPDYIGVSLRNIDDVLIKKRETPFSEAIALCEFLRQKSKAPIIIHGAGYSIFPERLLDLTGASYGICGEGEKSVVLLLDSLKRGESLDKVPGLVFRQSGKVSINPSCHRGFDNESEFARRPQGFVDHYLRAGGMLNLQTQRGCALTCCFCTYPIIEGRCHRLRSADAIAIEMQEMSRKGARYIFVVDSVFNSSRSMSRPCVRPFFKRE